MKLKQRRQAGETNLIIKKSKIVAKAADPHQITDTRDSSTDTSSN